MSEAESVRSDKISWVMLGQLKIQKKLKLVLAVAHFGPSRLHLSCSNLPHEKLPSVRSKKTPFPIPITKLRKFKQNQQAAPGNDGETI